MQADVAGHNEVKTQFATREGVYRVTHWIEDSAPGRLAYGEAQNVPNVQLSYFPHMNCEFHKERFCGICFNHGKELHFNQLPNNLQSEELAKLIDKRSYKGTLPSCHDITEVSVGPPSTSVVVILIGFSSGQIQLIRPYDKDYSHLFNEDRLIDKTKITCIRWIPQTTNQFLVSHASGQMYVYNEQLSNITMPPPTYQAFKDGDQYAVFTCKTKTTRNPLWKWVIGNRAINMFAFSPCAKYLAVVSQDGYLRVFDFHTMELLGSMRSFFGGLLSVNWSPDGRYIVTGGEDDLICVYAFTERRVVCRGKGHHSWVSNVTFDSFVGNADELRSPGEVSVQEFYSGTISYRILSVGQDTQLCVWDLTEDVLRQSLRPRFRSSISIQSSERLRSPTSSDKNELDNCTGPIVDGVSSHQEKESTLRKKLGISSEKKSKEKSTKGAVSIDVNQKILGTPVCPSLRQVPLIEPLVCKKIANDKLTGILCTEQAIFISSADGVVQAWLRPVRESVRTIQVQK